MTSTAAAGPLHAPVFHLHPLLRCNLRCAHCYSDSSPHAREQLPLETAVRAIRQAAKWKYAHLAVSGGEPLLYRGLGTLLHAARDEGMRTSVVTNGLLLDRDNACETLRLADTVAVSVDGLAASHDALRRRSRAFSSVERKLALLRDNGIDYVVVCGVTARNLDEVEALAAQACEWGASGLQLHAVEAAGRARTLLRDQLLSASELELLYVAASLLRGEYSARLAIRIDLVHRSYAVAHPHVLYAHQLESGWRDRAPASLLGVMVLDAVGTLQPVSYGFSPEYAIGNVSTTRYDALWRAYLDSAYPRLRRLGKQVYDDLQRGAGADVFNPSDLLAQAASHEPCAVAALPADERARRTASPIPVGMHVSQAGQEAHVSPLHAA